MNKYQKANLDEIITPHHYFDFFNTGLQDGGWARFEKYSRWIGRTVKEFTYKTKGVVRIKIKPKEAT